MMDIMSKLTDKPEWHRKVFNKKIVAKWKKEALAVPDDVWVNACATLPLRQWKPISGVISAQAWKYVSMLVV